MDMSRSVREDRSAAGAEASALLGVDQVEVPRVWPAGRRWPLSGRISQLRSDSVSKEKVADIVSQQLSVRHHCVPHLCKV